MGTVRARNGVCLCLKGKREGDLIDFVHVGGEGKKRVVERNDCRRMGEKGVWVVKGQEMVQSCSLEKKRGE